MTTIICQKQFTGEGNYTQEDIEIFNKCIQDGIKELKHDWQNPESDGIYITETDNELCFELDESKIDFENIYSNMKQIQRDIMAVVDNYCIPYSIN